MLKFIPKSCFFDKISLKIQFFLDYRNSQNFVLGCAEVRDKDSCAVCNDPNRHSEWIWLGEDSAIKSSYSYTLLISDDDDEDDILLS